MRSHLRSPDEMNWSITTWAPLEKSPNWASHKVRTSGCVREYPYSNFGELDEKTVLEVESKVGGEISFEIDDDF